MFCNKYVVEGAVSWESKNQTFVALSSIEVDFVVFALVARERVWLQRLLMEFKLDDYLLHHNLRSQHPQILKYELTINHA